MKYLIKDGRVVDPKNKIDSVLDILISGGKIERIEKAIKDKSAKMIDAKGKIVVPGLIDMHVHLREPGREDKETVKTGTQAAVSGGVTSLCCMPNTEPAIDSPEKVKALKAIIKKDASSNTFIIGAITENREGKKLTDAQRMKKEGIVGLSDDGCSIEDPKIMSEALKQAKKHSLPLISHCEDKRISKKGVVNEGVVATRLGLKSIPKRSEVEFVKRDIELAGKTDTQLHIAHVSCKESVELVGKAKMKGIKVTAEVTPHHFLLTDECCLTYDTNMKVNPPLRSKEDVEAIQKALSGGTIDVIASDHAPHGRHEKDVEFDFAAFGAIGLETSLAMAVTYLIDTKLISWKRLVELMSLNPARILGLKNKGSLSVGCDADITVINPEKQWTYKESAIKSKSKNSPFINWQFKGKVETVFVGGEIVSGKTTH